jgi:hypothetical protein
VRFNPAEPDVFATTGSDRGIALYDLRSSTAIRKLVMQTRTNAIAWNPMEAFNFTGGWWRSVGAGGGGKVGVCIDVSIWVYALGWEVEPCRCCCCCCLMMMSLLWCGPC